MAKAHLRGNCEQAKTKQAKEPAVGATLLMGLLGKPAAAPGAGREA
jgi:hypothetical protein